MTSTMMPLDTARQTTPDPIRPFQFHASDEDLADLRQRIKATRWPEKEPVADFSQGVPLVTMQKLARYWTTEYDWRKVEAKLNSYPQFITNIDGLDIHFIHVRSKEKNALPVIVTHGWPGSIIEQLKIIDPLTNPTAHGGKASDAFHVVIPSMPGYGFSGKPTTTGWDQARIARAWAVLMKRLRYTRYVAQGGDWGAIINDLMATQGHPELIGMHTNLPAVIPPEINKAAAAGGGLPAAAALLISGGITAGRFVCMPINSGCPCVAIRSLIIAPQSPPCATYRVYRRRFISTAQARAMRAWSQPAVVGLPENP